MKTVDYASPPSDPAPPLLVAIYWVCYAGAVLEALLALLIGLGRLTDFAWIDDRSPPGMGRRLFAAAPYFLFAALVLSPFQWTGRGWRYWTRLLLLILPAVIVAWRTLSRFVDVAPTSDRIAIVATGALLALCLMPASALVLWRHLHSRPSSRSGNLR